MSALTHLAGAILLMLGAVMPVVNPLAMRRFFLSLTAGCDRATRAELAKRDAFLLLLGAMLLGSFILRLFGLSNPVVLVAGGVVARLRAGGFQKSSGAETPGGNQSVR